MVSLPARDRNNYIDLQSKLILTVVKIIDKVFTRMDPDADSRSMWSFYSGPEDHLPRGGQVRVSYILF